MNYCMTTTNPVPATRRPAFWRLTLLTAGVVLAHWIILRSAPLALAAHESRGPSEATWAFSSRTIEAEPPRLPPPLRVPPRTAPVTRKPAQPESGNASANQTSTALSTQSIQKNTDPALVEYAEAATESVATEPDTPNATTVAAAPAALPGLPGLPGAPGKSEPDATLAPAAKPPPAVAQRKFAFPPSARMKYAINGEVKGFPYHVNGELSWVQDGTTYDARMEISHFLLGSRIQTSTGKLTANGLEPTRFGDKVRSEVAAHFERDKNKVIFSANTPEAALLPGAQDQLSIFIQIASMLGADPTVISGASTLAFQAVGPRSAESWVFNVGALEKLDLPGGEVSAVRLWRDPSGEYDTKVEVWLAAQAGYLPVRIRLTQANGDFVDQQWRSTMK